MDLESELRSVLERALPRLVPALVTRDDADSAPSAHTPAGEPDAETSNATVDTSNGSRTVEEEDDEEGALLEALVHTTSVLVRDLLHACEEEAAHAPRPPAKELVQRALATVLRRYDVDSTLPSAPPPAAAPAVAPAPAATQEAGTLSETVVAWMRTHGYEPLQAGDAFTLLHVDDALTLRRVFEALRDVAPTHTELVLTLSAHAGLRVQAFGPNDVSLCDCVLAPRFFGALHVDSERCLGVSVAAMSTFLRQAQRRDTLTLLQRTHDPSVCDLVLCDASRVMHYALRLKQLQPRLLHITQPPRYDAELRVDAAQWQRALRELKAHAPAQDTVTLHVTGKATVLEAQARYGTVALTLAPRDVEVASFAQRFTGHFMLSTLLSFTRATPLATHARLRVCAHEPLMLAYELPDGSGHLHYYLAPKIAPSTAPF